MAAAFSTPIRPIHTKTPTLGPTSSRTVAAVHTVRLGARLRQGGRRQPPGPRHLRHHGLLLLLGVVAIYWAECYGNPLLTALGVDPSLGNFEGKEVRFGTALSALFAARPPAPAPARSSRCMIYSRRSAAWSRCSTCSPAASGQAASARGSTASWFWRSSPCSLPA